jgi:hypothetical protein
MPILTIVIVWESDHSILGIDVVEVQKNVSRVSLLTEPGIDDCFFLLLEDCTRDMVHLLQFCSGIGIEHVGHPFSLDGFDRMVYPGATGFK